MTDERKEVHVLLSKDAHILAVALTADEAFVAGQRLRDAGIEGAFVASGVVVLRQRESKAKGARIILGEASISSFGARYIEGGAEVGGTVESISLLPTHLVVDHVAVEGIISSTQREPGDASRHRLRVPLRVEPNGRIIVTVYSPGNEDATAQAIANLSVETS